MNRMKLLAGRFHFENARRTHSLLLIAANLSNPFGMRFIRSLAKSLARIFVMLAAALLLGQHWMIYHPRAYGAGDIAAFKQVQPLSYSTSEGRQQCYYVPARSANAGQQPGAIWVLFGGNGGLALDWMDLVSSYPSAQDAFLLIDYPGYGSCTGSPSRKTIQESSDAALAALAGHLGVKVAALEPRLRVLGHSLGAASALGFASAHPVSRVVLLAPFTTLRDMARRSVGWPLCYLLLDNFDNRARLQEITHRSPAPSIDILSGTDDAVIPFTMGAELGRSFPHVHFKSVAGAGHNSILSEGEPQIFAVMTAPIWQ